jgi:hypothetical protein
MKVPQLWSRPSKTIITVSWIGRHPTVAIANPPLPRVRQLCAFVFRLEGAGASHIVARFAFPAGSGNFFLFSLRAAGSAQRQQPAVKPFELLSNFLSPTQIRYEAVVPLHSASQSSKIPLDRSW